MKQYLSIDDIDDLSTRIREARDLKTDPGSYIHLGRQKTLGLLFFNNSLRTRLSSQKAAYNLGMDVMVLNVGQDGWALEFEDNVIMDGEPAEHIEEAAKVVGQYCDLIGIRAFAGLLEKDLDEQDRVINAFASHSGKPVVNLESSLGHPLQALADAITIEEFRTTERPKVVLSWAPHPKALPHAVPHSFVRMAHRLDLDLVITHPEGYELNPQVTGNSLIEYDQEKALHDADFVYVKNWCSYTQYGKVLSQDSDWMITSDKLGAAKFMHCLPVRRNVVVTEDVLQGGQSLVIEQANNRTYAAQLVFKKLLMA